MDLEKLKEAPIDTYQTIGDFSKGSSFKGKMDRAIITHPVAVQKVKDFFKNTKVDFDFYFVNSKEGTRHFDKGEVKEDFLYKEEGLNIKKEQLKGGKINYNNITMFFGNNIGDSKIPMTPWIMAHRFGHAIRKIYSFEQVLGKETQDFLYSILENFYGIKRPPIKYGMRDPDRKYDIALKNLCQEIGTFKSARDKNIVRQYEYHFELLAQYLKNGKVTFNDLPDNLVIGHAAFGRKISVRLKDKEESRQYLESFFERTYPYYVEDVLSECEGKIFIM